MIETKVKKWGNSVGILIPKEDVKKLHLKQGEQVLVNIQRKENPLNELWGFGQKMGKIRRKSTKEELQELRELESKWT
jgi:antitoxin component of MazEF toxin-antitoxin module